MVILCTCLFVAFFESFLVLLVSVIIFLSLLFLFLFCVFVLILYISMMIFMFLSLFCSLLESICVSLGILSLETELMWIPSLHLLVHNDWLLVFIIHNEPQVVRFFLHHRDFAHKVIESIAELPSPAKCPMLVLFSFVCSPLTQSGFEMQRQGKRGDTSLPLTTLPVG